MTNNLKEKIFLGLFIIFVLGTLSWIGWGIASMIGNYADNVYPLSKADAKFSRAQGTNSLSTFANYAEDGLGLLEPYSGNEAWIFPTDNTNMDVIKGDIQIIINNSRAAANVTNYGSDAYQEALDNAKESLTVQMDKLIDVKYQYGGLGRRYVGLIWGWILAFIAIIVFMFVFAALSDYFYY